MGVTRLGRFDHLGRKYYNIIMSAGICAATGVLCEFPATIVLLLLLTMPALTVWLVYRLIR